jgi:hypothetical protein
MSVLSTELRNKLEKVVIEARDVAEEGARIALESLAVHHYEAYAHMDEGQRKLRNRLRARARQLGDAQEGSRLEIRHLICEVAYEHWHRMLFAQFLAENNLLIEPEMGIAITMDECEELAREAGVDSRALAARFAQGSLPQIFREGDPVLELTLPPETQQALDRLLDSLPLEVLTADDSLGWTYQFWQSKRKKEVNASGNKIGADELPAVTQLFTEHYMVQFLYHNTIGAWHAGKVLSASPKLARIAQSEQELRDAVRLKSQGGYDFEYLRFVRELQEGDEEDNPTGPWRPAAGTFEGWPKTAKEITVLDPCCGSGHFLNEGFQLLVRLRMDEEVLNLEDAITAVLSDNLHGLEIDPRCTQIAAFNVALAAWKLAGKPIDLPPLCIACSGLAVGATKGKWISLAGDDPRLRAGMGRLYDLFEQAPLLGSLIDPKSLAGNLLVADFAELQPLLEKALQHERENDELHERAVAAQGMAMAAELLSRAYTLALTNVPYLARRYQSDTLSVMLQRNYPDGKGDLACSFIERLRRLVQNGSSIAVVSPQNWLFQRTYQGFRARLLQSDDWRMVAILGAGAFSGISGEVVKVQLNVISSGSEIQSLIFTCDASEVVKPLQKARTLRDSALAAVNQAVAASSPGCRITAEQTHLDLLQEKASSYQGMSTADNPRFRAYFWENNALASGWKLQIGSTSTTEMYGGREFMVDYKTLSLIGREFGAALRGQAAWNNVGVTIRQTAPLYASLYQGECFDISVHVLVPKSPSDLAVLWTYCSDPQYYEDVKKLDKKRNVTTATIAQVPFDLAHWQKVSAKKYPNGLPEPQSDDPTQWLFHGHPAKAEPASVLQVAVGRLLGYRWPPELNSEICLADEAREWVARCDELLECADKDGIACIPSIRSESPAADRLRALLAAAFGDAWTPEKERELIGETGSKATDLDAWLRNDFFEQHCKLFHHRPFVWHIWDGRKRDGFHALVNYHKLAEGDGVGRRTLESLTYSYLNDWITRQEDGVKRGTAGAEDRLAAALELRERLVSILEGEPPFDLFIRWKSLAEQSIGWSPDINDGVRLNARPFLVSDIPGGKKGAGIFRWKPNIKWAKDRGKEPASLRPEDEYPWFWSWDEQAQDFLGNDDFDGNRWNNLHYTNETKRKAKEEAKERGH